MHELGETEYRVAQAQSPSRPRVLLIEDDASFATGRLHRGDRVVVRDEREDGWLAIDPPEGSISLIDRDAIDETGDGRARVVVARSSVRGGRDGAKLPGAPIGSLRQGDTVELLDQPALTIRQGRTSRTWVAIRPPPGELRYVRVEGIRRPTDLRRLSRALIELEQAKAEAQAEAEHKRQTTPAKRRKGHRGKP